MPDGNHHSPTSFDLAGLLRPTSPTTPMEAVSVMIDGLGLPTPPDLDRFIADEIQRERVRFGAWDKEAARSRGVCMSGMSCEPFAARTPEQLVEAAKAVSAGIAAFHTSPRGRFLAAVIELGNAGFVAEANAALAIYGSRLADEREPVDAAAAARATRILSGIDHSTARAGVAALADLTAALNRAAA